MDEIATKAVVVAVSILVTLTIVTILILEYSEIGEIYKGVGETNISFEGQFDELDKFRNSGNVFNGIEVRNFFKKYKDNKTIDVCVDGLAEVCNDFVDITGLLSTDEYKASLEETTIGYKIIFTKTS